MINLDYLAAKYAQTAILASGIDFKKMDGVSTTCLNILHEQGIYAMFVWLKEKGKNCERCAVIDALNRFFRDKENPVCIHERDLNKLDDVRDKLTQNLKSMFLAKNLMERMLIYVRHTAKAKN